MFFDVRKNLLSIQKIKDSYINNIKYNLYKAGAYILDISFLLIFKRQENSQLSASVFLKTLKQIALELIKLLEMKEKQKERLDSLMSFLKIDKYILSVMNMCGSLS